MVGGRGAYELVDLWAEALLAVGAHGKRVDDHGVVVREGIAQYVAFCHAGFSGGFVEGGKEGIAEDDVETVVIFLHLELWLSCGGFCPGGTE